MPQLSAAGMNLCLILIFYGEPFTRDDLDVTTHAVYRSCGWWLEGAIVQIVQPDYEH